MYSATREDEHSFHNQAKDDCDTVFGDSKRKMPLEVNGLKILEGELSTFANGCAEASSLRFPKWDTITLYFPCKK